MMGNDKARNTMMAIAGGYLIYLGVKLIRDVLTTDIDNEMLFAGFGILFVVAGVLVIINKLKAIAKQQYMEEMEVNELEIEADKLEEINENIEVVDEK